MTACLFATSFISLFSKCAAGETTKSSPPHFLKIMSASSSLGTAGAPSWRHRDVDWHPSRMLKPNIFFFRLVKQQPRNDTGAQHKHTQKQLIFGATTVDQIYSGRPQRVLGPLRPDFLLEVEAQSSHIREQWK